VPDRSEARESTGCGTPVSIRAGACGRSRHDPTRGAVAISRGPVAHQSRPDRSTIAHNGHDRVARSGQFGAHSQWYTPAKARESARCDEAHTCGGDAKLPGDPTRRVARVTHDDSLRSQMCLHLMHDPFRPQGRLLAVGIGRAMPKVVTVSGRLALSGRTGEVHLTRRRHDRAGVKPIDPDFRSADFNALYLHQGFGTC
jgi:hypothetical protein